MAKREHFPCVKSTSGWEGARVKDAEGTIGVVWALCRKNGLGNL